MPSKSKAQRKFFGLVHAIQSGKVHPSKVSMKVRKAAKKISSKDVKDFAKTPEGNLPYKVKKEIISVLKELQEPMYLNEDEAKDAVAKTFNTKGNFDQYIQKFVGSEFLPKELDTLHNHKEQKPTKIQKNEIRYETTSDFGTSTINVVKKLKDGSGFAYTSFTKYLKNEDPSVEKSPEESQDTIVVTKSQVFTDEVDGAAILANFLKKLDL